MSITKGDALKIVQAIESATWSLDSSYDHSEGVVANALNKIAQSIGEAFDLPECTCKWGHPSGPDHCALKDLEDGL